MVLRLRPHAQSSLAGLVAALSMTLAGCALLAPDSVLGPAGPVSLPPVPSAGASPASSSVPAAPTPETASAPSPTSGGARPTPWSWPSGSTPTEPPCALPNHVPDVVTSGGPTLTMNRVAKAWRASKVGRSSGVSTGTVKASRSSQVQPASVVSVAGKEWVSVNFREWMGMSTVVFSSPGEAAGKLATIRAMLRHSCSYLLLPPDGYVVATLARDNPDDLFVTGTIRMMPTADLFVRVGNTITYVSFMLGYPTEDEWTPLIRSTLAKA